MNLRKQFEGHEDLRPAKKTINSATGGPECAAEGVEPAVECKPCGEGIDGTEPGTRKTIRVATPYKPSQAEVDDHYLTHLPYRSWCKHCIRGRGKETSHDNFFATMTANQTF